MASALLFFACLMKFNPLLAGELTVKLPLCDVAAVD